MNDVGRRYPDRVTKSALPRGGPFWRYLFVPLYRRIPWSFKRDAMYRLKMTARNWPQDARRFGEPWHPPVADRLTSVDASTGTTSTSRET
jgi:hypothetical protein